MSTDTLEVVDLDVNLDEPVMCSGRPNGVQCTNEAKWRLTHIPCGCQYNGCNPCKEKAQGMARRWSLLVCECGVVVTDENWRPL